MRGRSSGGVGVNVAATAAATGVLLHCPYLYQLRSTWPLRFVSDPHTTDGATTPTCEWLGRAHASRRRRGSCSRGRGSGSSGSAPLRDITT